MARVLVVDDDNAMRSVLRRLIERGGHTVMDACEGHEALKLAAEHTVDLVLTDIIMPGMEGIELILKLRRSSPSLKIIAMSGGGRLRPDRYLGLANSIGADATLEKPFESSELLSTINALVNPEPGNDESPPQGSGSV